MPRLWRFYHVYILGFRSLGSNPAFFSPFSSPCPESISSWIEAKPNPSCELDSNYWSSEQLYDLNSSKPRKLGKCRRKRHRQISECVFRIRNHISSASHSLGTARFLHAGARCDYGSYERIRPVDHKIGTHHRSTGRKRKRKSMGAVIRTARGFSQQQGYLPITTRVSSPPSGNQRETRDHQN